MNRILNLHAPGMSKIYLFFPFSENETIFNLVSQLTIKFVDKLEWSGEVRSINYSSDGKSVSVVYRVTLYGTDAEVLLSLLLASQLVSIIKVFFV